MHHFLPAILFDGFAKQLELWVTSVLSSPRKRYTILEMPRKRRGSRSKQKKTSNVTQEREILLDLTNKVLGTAMSTADLTTLVPGTEAKDLCSSSEPETDRAIERAKVKTVATYW